MSPGEGTRPGAFFTHVNPWTCSPAQLIALPENWTGKHRFATHWRARSVHWFDGDQPGNPVQTPVNLAMKAARLRPLHAGVHSSFVPAGSAVHPFEHAVWTDQLASSHDRRSLLVPVPTVQSCDEA